MKRIYSKYKSILNLAIVIASLVVFNIVANKIFFRVDLKIKLEGREVDLEFYITLGLAIVQATNRNEKNK
jgi:hypothetical protein